MKTKSTLQSLKHSLATLVLGLTLVLPLHAAITDADLAKVTQLIQQGKTTRAKAEITILLDDNPSDANAPKLRKILDSIGKSETTTTGSQTDGPTEKETIEWLKTHIADTWTDSSSGDLTQEIVSLELTNGKIVIVATYDDITYGSSSRRINMYTFDLADVVSAVLVPSNKYLEFYTKPQKVVRRFSTLQYTVGSSADCDLDGQTLKRKDVDSWMGEATEYLARRVKNGLGKSESISKFMIPVGTNGERFKKAFDRLIQLHGGGKAEAF